MAGQQNPPHDYGQVANRRHEVDGVPVLKLHLADWENEKTQKKASVESYRGRCNAAKTELYQLMGFYFVFQGVVFTAVAQTSKLTCRTSFFPAVLSGLASIATAVSVHFKLDYYETQKLKLIQAKAESLKIINKIRLLKGNGKDFDFSSIKDTKGKSDGEKKKKFRRQIWWVVMLFLSVFSSVILASCIVVLC